MIMMDENIRAIVYQKFCDRADYMAGVYVKDGVLTATGRIRWYREDTGDPFKDKDDKHWGEIHPKHRGKPLDEILKVITDTAEELVAKAIEMHQRTTNDPLYVLKRGEDETLAAFWKRFERMPWVHKKVETVQ